MVLRNLASVYAFLLVGENVMKFFQIQVVNMETRDKYRRYSCDTMMIQ